MPSEYKISKKIIECQINGNYLDLIQIYCDLHSETKFNEYLPLIALIHMYKLHDFDSAYDFFKQYLEYDKKNIFVNWQLTKLAAYKGFWDVQEKLVKDTINLELDYPNKLKDFSIFMDCSKKTKILPCLFSLRHQTNSNFEVFVFLPQNSDKKSFYEKPFNHDRRFNFINNENEIRTNSKHTLILDNSIYNLNFLDYIISKNINENIILKNKYNHSIFMPNNQQPIKYNAIKDIYRKQFNQITLNENCTCLNHIWDWQLKHLFYKNISFFIPFLPIQIGKIND